MSMPNGSIGENIRYPTEMATPLKYVAVRQVRVDWSLRYDWANWFQQQYYYPYTLASGQAIFAGLTTIGIRPDEKTRLTMGPLASSEAVYGKALITLGYELVSLAMNNMVIEELQPVTRCYNTPSAQYYWPDQSLALTGRKSIYLPGYQFSIRYPNLSTIMTQSLTLNGSVNSDAFTPRLFWGISFNPGTLLYRTGRLVGSLRYDGTAKYMQEHHLLWQPWDWNMEWNPLAIDPNTGNAGTWQYQYTKVTNQYYLSISHPYRVFTGVI